MRTANARNNPKAQSEANDAAPHVSRASDKLAGFASAIKYDFRDKVVLDIGSSTGGWTQYALARGAAKVIAIEKGARQMKPSIKADPRVEVYEKTDIFDVSSQDPSKKTVKIPPPDVILADVSFISLTKILKYAIMELARSNTDFLVMLKPQFEASKNQLHQGVVKNETIRRDIIKQFESWLRQHDLIILAKKDSTLRGRYGNLERLYHLRLTKSS